MENLGKSQKVIGPVWSSTVDKRKSSHWDPGLLISQLVPIILLFNSTCFYCFSMLCITQGDGVKCWTKTKYGSFPHSLICNQITNRNENYQM